MAGRVGDWIKANRKTADDWRQIERRLEESAKKVVEDISPIDVLNHWLEREMAELLSNPQLPEDDRCDAGKSGRRVYSENDDAIDMALRSGRRLCWLDTGVVAGDCTGQGSARRRSERRWRRGRRIRICMAWNRLLRRKEVSKSEVEQRHEEREHWWRHWHSHWRYRWDYVAWVDLHRGLGTVLGQVVNAGGGPIQFAQVNLRRWGGKTFLVRSSKHIVHTGPGGDFIMRGVRAGGYRIVAAAGASRVCGCACMCGNHRWRIFGFGADCLTVPVEWAGFFHVVNVVRRI